jgi:heme exporter protein A
MLLDEPETGLDQQAITMAWEALHKEGETKRTIILVTHNLERGLDVGERLMILARGKIVYEHTTQALDVTDLKQAYEHSTRVGA